MYHLQLLQLKLKCFNKTQEFKTQPVKIIESQILFLKAHPEHKIKNAFG